MIDRVLALIDREEHKHLKLLVMGCALFFVGAMSVFLFGLVHASGNVYYLATTGNDSNACSEDSPCLSFNRAYRVASPGDIVKVAAGTYGDQDLIEDSSKANATQPVIFQPLNNADVTIGQLDFGMDSEAIGASHVIVESMTSSGWAQLHRTTDVTLRDMVFHGAVSASGAQQLTITGGSWGDAAVTNDAVHPVFQAYAGSGSPVTPDGLTISGVYIHDIQRPNPSLHTACLEIAAGTNITVRGNRFHNCDELGSLVTPSGSNTVSNITYENNIFEATKSVGGTGVGTYTLQIDPTNAAILNFTVRNNTFIKPWTVGTGSVNVSSGSFTNNLGYSNGSCATAINQAWTFSHNIWVDGGNCDPSDTNNTVNNIMWTSNYHIQSNSVAVDVGDPSNCASKDIDGDSRPYGSACDVGADEYVPGSPAAPVNSTAPSLSGGTVEAQALVTSHGAWTNSPAYTFQWQRCNSGDTSGASCVNIASATGSRYILVTADVSKSVRSAVIATNEGGATTAYSPLTATITADIAAPVNTVAPSIFGTLMVTSVLTASHGAWTNSPAYTFQWQRCNSGDTSGASCVNIANATGSTYPLIPADKGKALRVIVTASNSAGTASAQSAITADIVPVQGDFNNDTTINMFDLAMLLDHWDSTSSPDYDLNHDGATNMFDLAIFLSHYN
ncbi:MAG: hydrolase family protein [Candidatus Saccharibacteria bacterium]|nr:hydrolase family protein [Candidatus Saccharibacteria bacterium]